MVGLPLPSVKFSVPVIVVDLGLTPGVAANVRLAGFPVWVIVRVSPGSGSLAVAERLTAVPSFAVVFADAVIVVPTGLHALEVTVSTVVPLPLNTGFPLSVAVHTMLYGLAEEEPIANVPPIVADAGLPLLAVKVRPAGFPACVTVITSPASASVAVAVRLTT